jgi:hypothetical protein
VPPEAISEIQKDQCLNSITDKIVEYGDPVEFVGNGDSWIVLATAEKRIVFSRANVTDCWKSGSLPLEQKYQVAVRRMDGLSFEVRVWLQGEQFKD